MDDFNLAKAKQNTILSGFTDLDIEKARAGVYADTPENQKLHRVGQKYGASKSEDSKEGKTGKEGTDEPTKKTLADHAKETSEENLLRVIKTSPDPKLREAAHEELKRRKSKEAKETDKKPAGNKPADKKPEKEELQVFDIGHKVRFFDNGRNKEKTGVIKDFQSKNGKITYTIKIDGTTDFAENVKQTDIGLKKKLMKR